jgi:membrane protease YdiL (CAAX protease family)
MIPEHDAEPSPPITLGFAFTLALLAPLTTLLWAILFVKIGVGLEASATGMAMLVTYGGMFALSAVRFRLPPARQLAFVPAPLSAWLAILFLPAAVIVSSELDNVLRGWFPPPPVPMSELVPASPLSGVALAIVVVGVFPLCYGVFFRGVLQPLAAARLGSVGAVLLTAFLSAFAACFFRALGPEGLRVLPPALFTALILCILRQCSRSLWPALALESVWGVVQICAEHGVFGLAGFDDVGPHTPHTPIGWVAGGAALTLIGLALCRAAARAEKAGSENPAQS